MNHYIIICIWVIYRSLLILKIHVVVMAFIAGEKLLGRYSKFVSAKKDGAGMQLSTIANNAEKLR